MQNLFYLSKEFKFQLKLLYTDYQYESINTGNYFQDEKYNQEKLTKHIEQLDRCIKLRDAIDEFIVADFINNPQKYNSMFIPYESPKNVYMSFQVDMRPTNIVALGVSSETEARRMMLHDIMTANMLDFSGCYCSELSKWKTDQCDIRDDTERRRFVELLEITNLVDSVSRDSGKTTNQCDYPLYDVLNKCSVLLYVAFLGRVETIQHHTIAVSCLDG